MNTLVLYLIAAVALLLSAYLIFRVLFFADYTKRGELSTFSSIVGSGIYFAWGGFPYIYGIPDWPNVHIHPILEILGWIFLWGGLAVMLVCIGWLGLLRSLGRRQTGLILSGPYRFSRNPQVVGCVGFGIGFGMLWPSGYALGWVSLLLVMTHMMVLTEEKHLAGVFADAYASYYKMVPRYVGLGHSLSLIKKKG
jgi:protein-S-isoprenylcysteine O-methyltransferase Ste14